VSTVDSGCTRLEEAISARIDGEDQGMDADVVDAHLHRCAGCRGFEAAARAQHRRLRVRPATGVPDLSARIMAAVPDGPSPRQRVMIGNRGLTGPLLGVAALIVAVVLVAGYVVGSHLGGSKGGDEVTVNQVAGSTQSLGAYPGATVMPASQVVAKPDVTLTDTSGQPYDMATATAGRVTLLYFGYTHCPDICPVNIALAAEAIHGLPQAERAKVTMVFVTTDPTRDTPSVIKAWLAEFTNAFPGDPAFVGLTAPQTKIHDAERQIDMLLSYAAQIDGPAGKYNVVHAGYTLVYSPDGFAHLQVTDKETPAEYTTTLAHLVQKGFAA
jgi:protein SCO1/2